MMNRKLKKKPLAYALKLLNTRPRSKEEIKKALYSCGHSAEEIGEVVTHLVHLDYLNDVKFMESWCYYRKHVSPRSRWFVKRELLLKGLSSQDLDEYFDQFYSLEEEKQCLMRIMQNRANRGSIMPNISTDEGKHQLFSSLLRKGFSGELVSEVLNLLQAK